MNFFDSHCHLNDEKFDNDRNEIISKLRANEISNCIVAGYDLKSSESALKLAEENDFIYAICGISPNDIPQNEDELWKQLSKIKKISNNAKVKAIGEIGLDYYWNNKNKKIQKLAFIEQIKIANELNIPIVIHTRDASIDTIEILKKNIVINKGIIHCCPQNMELIKETLKLGFYISFAGPITFKSSKNACEIVNLVPNDKLLIETDSPYLAPEPVRGTRNNPINVRYVATKIAEFRNITLEEVAKMTFENAKKILKI